MLRLPEGTQGALQETGSGRIHAQQQDAFSTKGQMTGDNAPLWLARFGDPAGENPRASAARLDLPMSEAVVAEIVSQAGAHGVIMAVARNLAAIAHGDAHGLGNAPGEDAQEAVRALIATLQTSYRAQAARNMALDQLGGQIQTALAAAGLPAVIVKGPDFARNVYGGLSSRAFTDIDILAAPGAATAVAQTVERLGFEPVEPSDKRAAYTERQYWREKGAGSHDLVEVHTDMVHAPKLRHALSMGYEDYAGPAAGGITMASRLVLAGLHGATSHLFDRLQNIVDMMMIARAGVDGRELAERARRSGAETPVRTGLSIAHAIFGCEACRALLSAVDARSTDMLARLLVSPHCVLHAQSSHRARHSWRRQAYRWLLARQAPIAAHRNAAD
ncbi:MAG: nucleotidyltransferase family protein [Rhodobiaceae bacterium]|nr:nucleotidyltransferase family protein [Rhodobiaceae bacterium]